MKVVLANLFNHNGVVYVKTYDETGIHQNAHDDFDSAVQSLVSNGYTIKSENANERGEYSLWFEKVQKPYLIGADFGKTENDVMLFDDNGIPGPDVRQASSNDEAYTKMIAERIAKGEIDSFKRSALPNED